jgi:hypothetical protein
VKSRRLDARLSGLQLNGQQHASQVDVKARGLQSRDSQQRWRVNEICLYLYSYSLSTAVFSQQAPSPALPPNNQPRR